MINAVYGTDPRTPHEHQSATQVIIYAPECFPCLCILYSGGGKQFFIGQAKLGTLPLSFHQSSDVGM